MTHNWMLQYPLFDELACLLLDLVGDHDLTLVIPDVRHVDGPISGLLNSLYKRFRDQAPNLILGFDLKAPATSDENGLVWSLHPHHLETMYFDFQVMPETLSIDVPNTGESKNVGQTENEPREPSGNAAEHGAWMDPTQSAFDSLVAASSAEVVRKAVEGVRGAFRSFDFKAVLRLGLRILEVGPPLTAEDASDLHHLLGVAAHNRQFATQQGSAELNAFLEKCYLKALETETRSEARCAIYYRLAVTYGRRHKDFENGQKWATRAVDLAQSGELSANASAYQKTWALNIRAYVLMRSKKLQAAARDARDGFETIDQALADFPTTEQCVGADQMLLHDFQSTHSLLAHNIFGLSTFLGKTKESRAGWLDKANRAIVDFPEIERYEASAWIHLYLGISRLDLALPSVLSGFKSAHAACDARNEYQYAVLAADIFYRLGRQQEAVEYCRIARDLRRKCKLAPLASIELLHSAALARLGSFDSARSQLDRVMAAVPDGLIEVAEIQAVSAWISAMQGDAVAADSAIEIAVDKALESGERDLLVRVAAATGEVARMLERPGEAEEAFEDALDIASVGDAESTPPPPGDLLRALVGIQELRGIDLQQARRCADLVVSGLHDPETWWLLPRLLEILKRARDASPDLLASNDLAEAVERLDTVTRQRQDCETGRSLFFPSSASSIEKNVV